MSVNNIKFTRGTNCFSILQKYAVHKIANASESNFNKKK